MQCQVPHWAGYDIRAASFASFAVVLRVGTSTELSPSPSRAAALNSGSIVVIVVRGGTMTTNSTTATNTTTAAATAIRSSPVASAKEQRAQASGVAVPGSLVQGG